MKISAHRTFSLFCLTFFSIFLADYLYHTQKKIIKMTSEPPVGLSHDQWIAKIEGRLQGNIFRAQKTLQAFLQEQNYPAQITVRYEDKQILDISIDLEPFDYIINKTYCLNTDGVLTQVPCFYQNDVSEVILPQHLLEEVLQEPEKLLNKLLLLEFESFILKVSSFSFATIEDRYGEIFQIDQKFF